MNRFPIILIAAAATLFAAALPAMGAKVTPNAKSLLKNKKVLIVQATNWNGNSHKTPKQNALTSLNAIKAAVGIANFTVVDNVENYTAATLAPYDIMVFNYVFQTQLAVGKPFETAFKAWLASGNKGWMGYHTSGANEPGEWDWFRDSVTVMRYHVHSVPAQNGKMTITTDAAIKAQPILQGIDESYSGTDEWYDFDLPPRAPAPDLWATCKVTYYLDEVTLVNKPTRPMNPHPMAWYREDTRKNRFYYSGFIHSDPGAASDFFYNTILRGLEYLAGYDTVVNISSQGNSILTMKGLSYVTNSRELRVETTGPHHLKILSAEGKMVGRFDGEGPATYHPEAFTNAGVYFVRYQGKSSRFTQRILVY
jgi:hypothetical protein